MSLLSSLVYWFTIDFSESSDTFTYVIPSISCFRSATYIAEIFQKYTTFSVVFASLS